MKSFSKDIVRPFYQTCYLSFTLFTNILSLRTSTTRKYGPKGGRRKDGRDGEDGRDKSEEEENMRSLVMKRG